ncbi:GMC oxidoreductase [Rhypophila decipiens]|uniref:GMC oxidoreductase n=1 Tax=Rhypophila decipiens TaxID=261697 RepID=A0AAN7B1B1_9PEZI|nr:GMC oxidoreductase [Rhypophila decipiens]
MMLSLRACLSFPLLSLVIPRAGCDRTGPRLPGAAFPLPGSNATYDYVIVGGGTAGLALASRLAESFSVAVIEAGGFYQVDNSYQSIVPFYALVVSFLGLDPNTYSRHPLMDWDLISQPLSGAAGRRIHYAQAKTLGGSSSINTLAYVRANRGFYDRWAKTVGDDSYKFENMLPFFKRSPKLTPPDWKKRNTPNATFTYDPSAFSSNGGPIQVSWANWVDPTSSWLAKGLQAMGIPLSKEGFNSGKLTGGAWSNTLINPKNTHRSSAYEFLDSVIDKTDIQVYHHTQALKINFDAKKRATSVLVSTDGLEYTISASREIVLSAGVFHSPQLLMVSGIGPKATLNRFSIPLVADLPGVGQNLQDKIFFNVAYPVNTPTAGNIVNSPATRDAAEREYLETQSGPLSSAGGYLAFEKLPAPYRTPSHLSKRTRDLLSELPSDWPEIEYIVAGFPDAMGGTIGSLSPSLIAPFSRGNLTIKSSSIKDSPVFDLGWLTDPADQELALATFKRVRKDGWEKKTLDRIKTGPELFPGAAVKTDEEILSYIRSTANQLWHAVGTCKMGKKGEEGTGAVVDSAGRVLGGVSGLRVVDASVFPRAPPSHPTATIYALAEKIADVIRRGGNNNNNRI